MLSTQSHGANATISSELHGASLCLVNVVSGQCNIPSCVIPTTTTTTCVYLDRQIALPIWGATHVFFLVLFIFLFLFFLFYFFYICISFIIFVILVYVVFIFLVSFSNISFVVILVEGSVCIPGHVSRTCSCVSILSGHFWHFVSLYLPLKLFFTSNSFSNFPFGVFSKYCVFVFPHRCSRFFS